jgi:hypothetical protein
MVVQKSLQYRRFREQAEMVHQLNDIYLDVLSPPYSASVQSRDPLLKHFGKHSNRDHFQTRDSFLFFSMVMRQNERHLIVS